MQQIFQIMLLSWGLVDRLDRRGHQLLVVSLILRLVRASRVHRHSVLHRIILLQQRANITASFHVTICL